MRRIRVADGINIHGSKIDPSFGDAISASRCKILQSSDTETEKEAETEEVRGESTFLLKSPMRWILSQRRDKFASA